MWGKFRLAFSCFFSTLIELPKQLLLWRNNRSIPPELPTSRSEQRGAVSSETEQRQPQPMIQQQQPVNNHHDRAQIENIMNMQWALLVAGACFAAVSVILQALQTRATLPSSTFPWFCMALEMAFLALLVSVYVGRHYHKASCVMEHVAVFFCAVAVLLAIWMTLHPPLKQMSVALFFIGFTTIILANRSLHDWV